MMELRPYPAYKDSGVPWLGDVPERWEVVPNRAVFTEVKERDHPEEPMLSVTIRRGVIRQQALLADSSKKDASNLDKSAYKLVRPGDIAYNKMRAWQGAVGRSEYRGIVSPAYVVQRPHQRADSRYLHYLLRTPAFAKEAERWSYGITSDMWSLRPEHFRMIYTCLPSPAEQSAIVRFLNHADRRIRRYIRAKQKLIALLEEQKQAIIHRAVTRGLDPSVRLKPSGVEWLGDVPEHWEVKRLRHVSPSVAVGVVVNPSSYFAAEGVPMLLGNNVLPGRFRLDRVARISDESNQTLGKTRLRSGDVVVVRVGAPGTAAVVTDALDGCNCASMMIVRKGPAFVSEWLMYLFNSSVLRYQIDMVKYGAAQKQFNIGHAVDFWCPLPGVAEQQRIVEHLALQLDGFQRAAENVVRDISLLREYRTRLIADVVTGKLDVRDAAARLPDEAEEPEPADEAEALAENGEEVDDAEANAVTEEAEA
jgi:type I restriction enzyme S subunit